MAGFVIMGKSQEEYDADIRAKAIDEFVEHITLPLLTEEDVVKILEQMQRSE